MATVSFRDAQIKLVSYKQLASGDYSLNINIQVDNPNKELLDKLNKANTNQGVCVAISDGFVGEQ